MDFLDSLHFRQMHFYKTECLMITLALPWVEPFLKKMGVPIFISKDPARWTELCETEVSGLNDRMFEISDLRGEEYHRAEREVYIRFLRHLLQKITEIEDREQAVQFELWLNRFFIEEIHRAFKRWKRLFCFATAPPDSLANRVSPPQFLKTLDTPISAYMSYERTDEIEARILEAKPVPPPNAPVEYYDGEVVGDEHGPIVEEAINDESVWRALRMLVRELSPKQLELFRDWSVKQSQAFKDLDCFERDRCEQYLNEETPLTSFPSILDLKGI